MSATIHYRKTDTADPYLKIRSPSAFMESMKRAFWRFPCELKVADIPTLRGMMIMFGDGSEEDNPYAHVIQLIEEHGSIELYASY